MCRILWSSATCAHMSAGARMQCAARRLGRGDQRQKADLSVSSVRVLRLHVRTGALEPARSAEPVGVAPVEGGAAPAENGSVSEPHARPAAGQPSQDLLRQVAKCMHAVSCVKPYNLKITAGQPSPLLFAPGCNLHPGSHVQQLHGGRLSACEDAMWQLGLPCKLWYPHCQGPYAS